MCVPRWDDVTSCCFKKWTGVKTFEISGDINEIVSDLNNVVYKLR